MRPHPKSNGPATAALNDGPVRFGQPVDEPQIRLLLMLGHAENSIFRFDVKKAEFIIRRLLYTPWIDAADTGLRGCFGVIGPLGGILEGLAMMAVSSQWYSHAPFLEEFIVYVHPEYRQRNHASELLDWMIARSDQMKIPLITGVISQTRMEAKCRLYKRKLTPVGQFFLHMPANMRWDSDVVLSSVISSSAAA